MIKNTTKSTKYLLRALTNWNGTATCNTDDYLVSPHEGVKPLKLKYSTCNNIATEDDSPNFENYYIQLDVVKRLFLSEELKQLCCNI